MSKTMDNSSFTTENEYDIFKPADPKTYMGTEEEKTHISYVMARLQKMYYARNAFPKQWDIYEEMTRARYKPLPGGKYRYGTSLTRAIRDIAVTNLRDRPPKPRIE